MDSHEIEALVNALKMDKVHLVDVTRTKFLFCADRIEGEWEVCRTTGRGTCVEHGKFQACLDALIDKTR